jgi:hypothetical protein
VKSNYSESLRELAGLARKRAKKGEVRSKKEGRKASPRPEASEFQLEAADAAMFDAAN